MMQSQDQHETLGSLDELNQYQKGQFVFLTSNDDVETRPAWLEGVHNIPAQPSVEDDHPEDRNDQTHHPAKSLGDESDNDCDLERHDAGGTAISSDMFRSVQFKGEVPLEENLGQAFTSAFPKAHAPNVKGGRSAAPAVLIVVPKADGIVDAFWFFFYSFNLGNSVLGIRFGNHVGDWDHTAVRFKNGIPQAVYFSEHEFGSAYAYAAVEKLGKRPVVYSATGTHAMYATPGSHPYILPFSLLHDETNRGPLWDPALNYHGYTYDYQSQNLSASTRTPKSPTGWFHFSGHWGDKFYPLTDNRQYRLVGQYHYVNGPLGPKFKNLGRSEICGNLDGTPCIIKQWLAGSKRATRWKHNGEEADARSKAHKAGGTYELK